MSICQTKINPRLPSFVGTFIFYVYRFVKITDYVFPLLMLPYMPYLSFKSRANQFPRNRTKFIHHLLSFFIKYKSTNVNSMWFIWKFPTCIYILVKCSLKCKCNQANTGSNRESVSAWSVGLNMGRGKHLSVERKEAIWNLFSVFQDKAERGRPRHNLYMKQSWKGS